MKIYEKTFVPVTVMFTERGDIVPVSIHWEDGTIFSIDKVLDVRPSHALKTSGQGDRYTISINGRETYLFFERDAVSSGASFGKWFVEKHIEL